MVFFVQNLQQNRFQMPLSQSLALLLFNLITFSVFYVSVSISLSVFPGFIFLFLLNVALFTESSNSILFISFKVGGVANKCTLLVCEAPKSIEEERTEAYRFWFTSLGQFQICYSQNIKRLNISPCVLLSQMLYMGQSFDSAVVWVEYLRNYRYYLQPHSIHLQSLAGWNLSPIPTKNSSLQFSCCKLSSVTCILQSNSRSSQTTNQQSLSKINGFSSFRESKTISSKKGDKLNIFKTSTYALGPTGGWLNFQATDLSKCYLTIPFFYVIYYSFASQSIFLRVSSRSWFLQLY